MKTRFKERLCAGLCIGTTILSIAAPMTGFADPSSGGSDKGQHDSGSGGGESSSKPRPSQPAPTQPAPTQPAPQKPAAPARPAPGKSGEDHPDRGNGGNGDGAAIAVGIQVGGAILGGIIHLIAHHDQTKATSYNWILADDGTLHCFGINKYGNLANNKSVEDAKCASVPQPVSYNTQMSSDGTPACYETYTPDGTIMNNNNPVDESLCPQEDQAPDQSSSQSGAPQAPGQQ